MAREFSLEDIAYYFRNCTGETNFTLKEFLRDNYYLKNDNDIYINKSLNNYIFSDIHILLKKAITNILAGDNLLQKSFSSWAFVTCYYSNFFTIQALNRLSLNFDLHLNNYYDVKLLNAVKHEYKFTKASKSSSSHQSQFDKFYTNFNHFKNKKSINRSWNIGIRNYKDGSETILRNEINYTISKNHFDELLIELPKFKRNIVEFQKDPKDSNLSIPYKYSHTILELALCRIEMILYLLNYIANKNKEYYSYYLKYNTSINKNIIDKYSSCSKYLIERLEKACIYNELKLEEEYIVY